MSIDASSAMSARLVLVRARRDDERRKSSKAEACCEAACGK